MSGNSMRTGKTPRTICQILEERAALTPDANAILAPEHTALSYARLYEVVRSLTGQLGEMGIGAGHRVGIVLPNGPEMAVAFLAVSSCAVSAPLNPAYRANEFDFYLSDLEAGVLIVQEANASPAVKVAAKRGIPVLEMPAWPGAGAPEWTMRLEGSLKAPREPVDSNIALMLHTSGTTSRPKMVPLTHSNLCISARNIAQWFSLGPQDRCLNIMPLFHIHGLVGAVLSSLSAGASIVCTPGFDATRFFDWVAQFQPTWYTAVPTMHQAILARSEQHKETLSNHPLRFIRSCSSALAPELMKALEETFRVPVVESYGMTEASHQIASNPLPPRQRKPGSVGLAAGPEVGIMDAYGNLLEQGRKGEIVLRGETMTAGYMANPDANQKSFTDGWFRTGDEGSLDAGGYIFISARIKEIINRGGEKISPREIDEVLLQCPGVAQAVTFSIPHAQLGEEIGAAVVLKPKAATSESDVRQFAAKHLAYFKVPRTVRIVGEIPKGPTGKIQRIGLSERLGVPPIDDAAAPRAEFREPGSDLERRLLQIWQEALAVPRIGVDDSFFAIGGDSILATKLIVRLARELGSRLSLVEFMEMPTIAGIAERMGSGNHMSATAAGAHALLPVQPDGTAPPLLCTPGLEGDLLGFWNLSRSLGRNQPLFVLANIEKASPTKALSIEGMASACIDALRKAEIPPPYFLLGRCFGGFVAYEMARQLSKRGETVALLVLLDCFNHGWSRNLSLLQLLGEKTRHAFTRSEFHLRKIAGLGARQWLPYLCEHLSMFAKNLRTGVRQCIYNTGIRLGYPVPAIALDVQYANRWAEIHYTRQPYSGRTVIYRTADPAGGVYPAPLMGWEDLLTGRVDEHSVPGDHLRMLSTPSVDTVAQFLQMDLERASRAPLPSGVQVGQ